MVLWQICICVGLIFLILELFMPLTFFLSLSIGAFATAIVSVWFASKVVLIPVFAILSICSLLIFRPFLAKNNQHNSSNETGIDGKYIGKIAKVVKSVNKNEGVISIYGERWEARSDENIEAGLDAEIIKNDSLIMYVKKSDK
ncbi:NfeD family protein [bacterium]|nr:NfeD family protein [bacterium]